MGTHPIFESDFDCLTDMDVDICSGCLLYPTIFILGWKISERAISSAKQSFIDAGLKGNDMGRADRPLVPESLGLISAVVFLVLAVVQIPFLDSNVDLVLFLGALLTITSAAFLGFVDDVLNLRWRHKLWAPAVSAVPLLTVYFIVNGETSVLLPKFLRGFEISILDFNLLSKGGILQLGPLYYCYLLALIIFCLNAINILSGVNGLEAGQTFIIGLGFICYNLIELYNGKLSEEHLACHYRSLSLIVPFVGGVFGLVRKNWYPAEVFVGDTFCYWAGCTLATTSIIGRFSKTGILFFIPQIFNFVYGLPQLFHIIPCPRHRLPRFNSDTGLREMSTTRVKWSKLNIIGKFWITAGKLTGTIWTKDLDDDEIELNNLTNLNLTLKIVGPVSEENLTKILIFQQILGCFLALFIRYYIAGLVY